MRAVKVNQTLYLTLDAQRTPARHYMLLVDVFLASGLILLGLVGNSLSIVLLRRDQRMRGVTRLLLQVLALTDLFYLLLSVFYQPLFTIAFDPLWGRPVLAGYLVIEPYVSPLVSVAAMAGTWTVLLVTTDRYVAIRYPLRAKTFFTTTKIKLLIGLGWLFAIAFNAVRFTGSQIRHRVDEASGVVTLILPLQDDLQYSPYYNLIYQVILVFLFRIAIPILGLGYLNVRLILIINKSSQKRDLLGGVRVAEPSEDQSEDNPSSTSRGQGRRPSQGVEKGVTTSAGRGVQAMSKQTSLMLVAVVSVFIISQIPNIYVRILWMSRVMASKGDKGPVGSGQDESVTTQAPEEEQRSETFDEKLLYAYSTSKLFLCLNASVNFLIYVVVGRRFRRSLVEMWRHLCGSCGSKPAVVASSSGLTPRTLDSQSTDKRLRTTQQ